jgi:hypothetical protein
MGYEPPITIKADVAHWNGVLSYDNNKDGTGTNEQGTVIFLDSSFNAFRTWVGTQGITLYDLTSPSWFSFPTYSPEDTVGNTTIKVNFWGPGGMTFVSPLTGTCTMVVGSMHSSSGVTSSADVSYNGSIIEDDVSGYPFTVGPFDVTKDNEIFFGNPENICFFYSIEFTGVQ